MNEFQQVVEVLEESRKGNKVLFNLIWAIILCGHQDKDADKYMGGMSKGHYKRVIRLARKVQSHKQDDNTTVEMLENAINFIRQNMAHWCAV